MSDAGSCPATPQISPEKSHLLASKKKIRSARFYWKPSGVIKVNPPCAAPNKKITVTWHIPLEDVSAGSLHERFKSLAHYCKSQADKDTLFLFRSRKRIDQIEGEIMTRNIKNYNHVIKEQKSNRLFATGRINLKTPKGVGEFDIRYFTSDVSISDETRGEEVDAILPVARSNVFAVEVQGSNLFEAFLFVKERISSENNVSNAVFQFCSLLNQARTLREPFLAQKFHSPKKQENMLLNFIFDTILLSIKQVKHNQEDIKKTLFNLENDVKGQASVEEFNKLEERRREIVNEGKEFDTDEFNEWKKKKGEKLTYERKISSCFLQIESLTSALRTVVDQALCCSCLKGKDKNGQSFWKLPHKMITMLIGLGLLYDPINNKFHEDIVELQQFYSDSLNVIYNRQSDISRVLGFKGFFRLVSRNTLSFGFPCGLGIRSPRVNIRESLYLELDRKISNDIITLTEPLIPAKKFFTSRVAKLISLENVLNEGLTKLDSWKDKHKVMLVPFGSSINNYGSYKSDLDVVLLLIPFELESKFHEIYKPRTKEEKVKVRDILWKFVLVNDIQSGSELTRTEIISDVMKILLRLNVTQVDDSRKTARIPLLKFNIPENEEIQLVGEESESVEYVDSLESNWLECDLCIDNRLALRNTLLLQTYSLIDDRVKYLAQTIKIWAKQRDINSSVKKTLPSYAYILLIIYYLQNISPPILPILQQISFDSILKLRQYLFENDVDFITEKDIESILYSSTTEINNVSVTGADEKHYNTYFLGDPCYQYLTEEMKTKSHKSKYDTMSVLKQVASKNKSSLYELLTGFFEFYAFQLDTRRVVVSIRNLYVVSKESKATEESWRINEKLSIEDPFEVSYDVAHVLKSNTFIKIRTELLRGYAILTNKLVSTQYPSSGLLQVNLIEKLIEKKEEPSKEPEIYSPRLTGIRSPRLSPRVSVPIRPPGF